MDTLIIEPGSIIPYQAGGTWTGPAIVQIGHATLHLGNAYALRPKLGWHDADVMDPPYKFANSGGGAFRKARGASDQIVREGLDRGFDASIINPALCGAVVVFCHNDQVGELIGMVANDDRDEQDSLLVSDMFARLQPRFHRSVLCVWVKPNPSPHRNKHYLADLEPFIHSWNKGYHPVGEHHDMHRWIMAASEPSKTYGHPTVKPAAVMDKIVRNVSGASVCDPFMGTGSTGVAAVKAGKRFTGIEHNPVHFRTAVHRLSVAMAAQLDQVRAAA